MNRTTIYNTDRPLKSVQTRPMMAVLEAKDTPYCNTGGNTGGL